MCISLYYRFTSTLIQLRVQLASTRIDTAAPGRIADSARQMPNTCSCTARNPVANAESLEVNSENKGRGDGFLFRVLDSLLALLSLISFRMSLTMSVSSRDFLQWELIDRPTNRRFNSPIEKDQLLLRGFHHSLVLIVD